MKKSFILLLVTLLGAQVTFAQKFKLAESSAKSEPAWITNIERGFIIASASASDVEAAKQEALINIKQQIAQSIMSNISVDILQTSKQITTNESSAYMAQSEEIIRSTTDKIPFLQSISLTKAADFYWAHYYDKKSGVHRYDYHLKYPFSDAELNALVAEFNAKQKELNDTIDQMAEELESFTQIETIAKNMATLRGLIPEFAEGDPRISRIDHLVNTYRDQYKYISMEEVENGDKRVVLQPYLNGRAVTTAQIPSHKSNCADRITKSVARGVIEVTYDDYVCRAGDDNFIELTFRFGTNFVQSRIHIRK